MIFFLSLVLANSSVLQNFLIQHIVDYMLSYYYTDLTLTSNALKFLFDVWNSLIQSYEEHSMTKAEANPFFIERCFDKLNDSWLHKGQQSELTTVETICKSKVVNPVIFETYPELASCYIKVNNISLWNNCNIFNIIVHTVFTLELILFIPTLESAKLRALRGHVPTSLACLHNQVSTCLACLRASVSCLLTCSCPNVLCVPSCSCSNVPKCSHAITSNNKFQFSTTCFT